MTPPSSTPDAFDVSVAPAHLTVAAIGWTEAGPSDLTIVLSCEPTDYGTFDVWVDHIRRGEQVLAGSSTASNDPDLLEPALDVEDLRIPNGAFVGSSFGVRLTQLFARARSAGVDPAGADRRLTPGQVAIGLIDFAMTQLEADGITGLTDRLTPDALDSLTEACRTVGAVAHGDLFSELPGSDPDQWENRFFDIEGSDPIWPILISFVEAHPEDFFCPEDA